MNLLPKNLIRGTENNHGKPQLGNLIYEPRFEPEISPTDIRKQQQQQQGKQDYQLLGCDLHVVS
jgi:hypothetical protein